MKFRQLILLKLKRKIYKKANMTDTFEHKDTLQGNERKCIATGKIGDRDAMYRFIIGPDCQVLPDLAAKLPGRGLWVSANQLSLKLAIEKNLFEKSAKKTLKVKENLISEIECLQSKRLLDLIRLARKAGQAVCGYEKVKEWLSKDKVLLLIQAYDGSGRGKSKLSTPDKAKFIGCLSSLELGEAFGRQNAIHCAVTSGGLAKRIVHEAHRLTGLRRNFGEKSPERKRQLNER